MEKKLLFYGLFFCTPFLNSCGNTAKVNINGTDVTSSVNYVILNDPTNLTYPNSAVDQYQIIPDIDYNDIRSGSPGTDSGMSYSCAFDKVVDSSVSSGASCNTLPGSFSFDTNLGIFRWRPNFLAFGPYEFKITGTHTDSSSAIDILVIHVKQPYVLTNLDLDLNAMFASFSGNGLNSPFTWIWANIYSDGSAGDAYLEDMAQTISSGWAGTGTIADPHRLVFDGTNDRVDLGTDFNAYTQTLFTTWINPAASTQTDKIILGNYDSSAFSGFQLRQSDSDPGKLEFQVGNPGYATVVLGDSPVLYLRLDETSGTLASNLGSGNFDGTYTGTYALGDTSAVLDSASNSVDFNGSTGHVALGNPAEMQITGDQTIEFWIRPESASARRNPYAKAYGGEGTITLETSRTFNYFYGTNGSNGSPYQGFGSSSVIPLNTWTHVVLVRDLTNMQLYWYFNGVQVATIAATYAVATAGSLPAYVGKGYVSNIDGDMDEVAIYNSALSATQILAHYQAGTTVAKCLSSTVLANNTWYHVSGIANGSTAKLYVNGSEECSVSTQLSAATKRMYLGAAQTGTNAWQGSVGGLRIYTSGTSTEVDTNYNATKDHYP